MSPGLPEAVADENLMAEVPGETGELGEQSRLADARIAGEDDHAGLARGAPEPHEAREPLAVLVAAHEKAASSGIQWHAADYGGVVGHR